MKLFIEDTISSRIYPVRSWKQLAETAISLAKEHKDYVRFLPACQDWNLDYPERGESMEDYRGRMIDMAIGLQLIG